MITTHLHWSSDITKAPKGEMVTTKTTVLHNGKLIARLREGKPISIDTYNRINAFIADGTVTAEAAE